jgi:hypothetical protein
LTGGNFGGAEVVWPEGETTLRMDDDAGGWIYELRDGLTAVFVGMA